MKRLSVRVDDDLYRQVKVKCAEQLLTIEGALTELLRTWVARDGEEPSQPGETSATAMPETPSRPPAVIES